MSVKIAGTFIQAGEGTGSDRHVEVGDPALVSAKAATGVERTVPGATRAPGADGRKIASGLTSNSSALDTDRKVTIVGTLGVANPNILTVRLTCTVNTLVSNQQVRRGGIRGSVPRSTTDGPPGMV